MLSKRRIIARPKLFKDSVVDSKVFSTNEVEELKISYDNKIQTLINEHEDQLDQVRQDMAIIVSSVTQGSSSDAIIDLQARIKDLEQENDDLRNDQNDEIEELRLNLKRSESANFFGLRRNEEMGSKIFYMQNEMEEMERKHQMIVASYQEKLESLGVDVDVTEGAVRYHEELEDKVKQLQGDLDRLYRERDSEMESFTLRLQEEKRGAIQEATDNVLRLESLIDEMKTIHANDKKEWERLSTCEKSDPGHDKRINELEIACETLKEEYEEEIEELTKEHKKEVEKLRLFYEKEISDAKRSTTPGRKSSIDHSSVSQGVIKEIKDKHDKEVDNLKKNFEIQQQQAKIIQEREIEDIRIQYDEKLKMSYKDGMRRQSVSERKSDASKIRDLITEKDNLSTQLLEIEIKYDKDTAAYEEKIKELKAIIAELRGYKNNDATKSTESVDDAPSDSLMLGEDELKKLEELQEQIRRYERRIDYYQQKSLRDNCGESERVLELQSDVVNLNRQIEQIKDSKRKAVYEKEKKEKAFSPKSLTRRHTDGSTIRRHTDTDAHTRLKSERDPRQRWSNLEERTQTISRSISELDGKRNPRLSISVKKEENKSGTVLARKTLWENITDEPKVRRVPSTDIK